MKTHHSHFYLPPLLLLTLAGIAGCILGGCQTNSATASHPSKKTLADYGNTFTIEIPPPDRFDFFKDNGATENAARQTVQMELASRGYDYHGAGAVSLLVSLNWISTVNNAPTSSQTAVSQAPADTSTRFITLVVTVTDPATGDIIWQSEPIMPVGPLKTFSQDNAAAMARLAVQKFPSYPARSYR